MSSGPAVSKGHAGRLFTVHHKMTQVCFGHARARNPHATHSTQVMGKRYGRKVTTVKNCPACPCTVLGLAQQHVALMCGPGPGAPVGVLK